MKQEIDNWEADFAILYGDYSIILRNGEDQRKKHDLIATFMPILILKVHLIWSLLD